MRTSCCQHGHHTRCSGVFNKGSACSCTCHRVESEQSEQLRRTRSVEQTHTPPDSGAPPDWTKEF